MREAKLKFEIKVAGVGVYQSVYELVCAETGEQLAFEVMEHPRKTHSGVTASVKSRVEAKLAELNYMLREEAE
ncbi:hypothetical protein JOC54_001606 [Alkalihalobacillus xiaoxiensis]|uniref:Uncharacterized protein n=1 Tax=Shouchella xiaoxiensis TaxID=766895 RepID=A0ABS2SU60_9BACI|nr:hypothetical protein [Shouchella xiaoxiensis]MBM7838350.1 hypothetical protein [Shouchella xiaoxiensis]